MKAGSTFAGQMKIAEMDQNIFKLIGCCFFICLDPRAQKKIFVDT